MIRNLLHSALNEGGGALRSDVVASTDGPGLAGSLVVGYNFLAKSIAWSLEKPFWE